MVGGDAEGHELLEIDRVGGISVEQFRAGGGEPETPAHAGGRDGEGGGDVLLGLVFLRERGEGAELIERVQPFAVAVLGEAVVFGDAGGLDDAWDGMGASLARRFCLTSSFSARMRRLPACTS